MEDQKIKKWEDKFDQELKLKEEEESIKFEQIKKKEQEAKNTKWEDKLDQDLKLKEEEESVKFEESKQNKQEEISPKEDLISTLENFETDYNKKN